MSNNLKIEVYSKDWCPYCKKAKAFLKSKGLKFEEIDIEEENNYLGKADTTGADLIYDFWDHIAKYKVETVIGEEAVGIEDRG